MALLEDRHWWYCGLRQLVVALLERSGDLVPSAENVPLRLLDAGAGTGGMLRTLRATEPLRTQDDVTRTFELVGIDASAVAHDFLRQQPHVLEAYRGSITSLPFGDDAFDAVVCLNVLEHESVDPHAAAKEMARCTRAGGVVIVNVAAYQWLFSYHDVAVSQARRFSRPELVQLLEDAGLTVERCSYWNSLLFPVMAVRRKLLPRHDAHSDVTEQGRLATTIGRAALRFERHLLQHGTDLPFGGAVIAVARKRRVTPEAR